MKTSRTFDQIVCGFSITQYHNTIHLNFCFRHMSTIIISFLFFLSSFNIVGCIIRHCCLYFRRWWKGGASKKSRSNGCSLSPYPLLFSHSLLSSLPRLCFTSIGKTDSWLCIRMNREYFVEEYQLTRWAKRIPSMICRHISGLSSKTLTKEFFIVRFWCSTNPFAWGW